MDSLEDTQAALRDFRKTPGYYYVKDEEHLLSFTIPAGYSSKMTTDFYLYGLAQKHGAHFVTFDVSFARLLNFPEDIIVLS
jgi:predicted nucleic acid-binding protein